MPTVYCGYDIALNQLDAQKKRAREEALCRNGEAAAPSGPQVLSMAINAHWSRRLHSDCSHY